MTIAEFTARQVREVIDECGFVEMEHSPYSPDLAPSDYYLFLKLNKSNTLLKITIFNYRTITTIFNRHMRCTIINY
jgi:hypothetical protein